MPFRATLDDLLLPAHGIHDGAYMLEASPDLAAMFGYNQSDDVVGSSLLNFIHPEHQDKTVRQVLSGEWGVYSSLGRKKDGSTFPLEVCARPIRYNGSPVRLILVRDLSPIALVVDDEPVVCKMTASLVRRLGFRTLLANSAELALAKFQPGKLSLLLTDITMPGMNGLELAKRLRAADPTLPIAYVTGFSPDEVTLDEHSRLISKPFAIADFERVIASLPVREIPASNPCGLVDKQPVR